MNTGPSRRIEQQFKQRSEQSFAALQQQAEAKASRCSVRRWVWAWLRAATERCSTPDLFEALPTGERERIRHDIEGIQHQLEAIMQQVPQWEREHREALQDAQSRDYRLRDLPSDGRVAGGLCRLPEVALYLDAVEQDVKENAEISLRLRRATHGFRANAGVAALDESRFRRYQVNVIVDNGPARGAGCL